MTNIRKPSLSTVFKKLDANGDGKVSTKELSSGLQQAAKGWVPGVDQAAKQLVDVADTDHDGELNWQETQALAGLLRPQLGALPTDLNSDGFVDRGEVKASLQKQGGSVAAMFTGSMTAAMKDFLDTDGDGKLSVEAELKPFIDDVVNKSASPTAKPDED